MNDITYKKLNVTKTITEAIPRIIEAFTIFYGEEEREKITKKFNNMLIIGYIEPKKIEQLFKEDKKEKSKELIEIFLNKLGIQKEEYNKYKKIYFDNLTLDNPLKHPINNYIKYRNGDKSEISKKETYIFLKQLYPNLKFQDLNKLILPIKKKNLKKELKLYKEILTEYSIYLETFKEQEKYIEKCNILKKELEKKYISIFIDEIAYLFTDEELKQIKESINNSCSIKIPNKKIENYIGKKLNSIVLIESFSKESDEILKSNQNWRKNSILKDRIQFFKNLGIDLGNNYENYINNKDIQRMMSSIKEIANEIVPKRKELYTKMMNEYYSSLDEFIKIIERIENENLLIKNHGFDVNEFQNNGTFVAPNLKNMDNIIIMYPLLCFSMGGRLEYLDEHLIHELNHVYELTIQRIDDSKYSYTCGWERITTKHKYTQEDISSCEKIKQKREYELFNEIINELISQEITNILFSLDGYIFNTKDNAKIKDGSFYENMKFLVIDFYTKYKKEIIESRRTGDISILYNKIGEHNFNLLNELIKDFNKQFSEATFYSIKNNLIKIEETKQAKKYYDFIRRRDNILKSMEEYNENKQRSM